MKRSHFHHIPTLLLSLCLLPFSASPAASEEGPKLRDLARKYFKDGDGKDLAKLIGYKQPVKTVVALEYKVMLSTRDANGQLVEKPVDPKVHEFTIGDEIRIEIQPLEDYYVYIFFIGASGESGFLLPAADAELTKAEAGKPVVLPDDGFFEFTDPPGEEMLMVVATMKPVDDLDTLAGVLAKKPGEKDTPKEEAVRKTLKATVKKALKSAREREKELLTNSIIYRGLTTEKDQKELAEDVRTRDVKEGTFEEPASDGTSAMYVSVNREDLVRLLVSIPLKSIPARPAKP